MTLRYYSRFLILPALLVLLSLQSCSHQGSISYEISMAGAAKHYFRVTMKMSGTEGDYTVLKMPVWTPGYYNIIDYPKNLSSFAVTDESNNPLSFVKTAKNIWKITNAGAKEITVTYDIYANNHSVAEPFIDTTHAFIAPAGLILYPEGNISHASEITFVPYKDWNAISTGLDSVAGKKNTYYAPDYDILFDSPVLAGNQEVISFDVYGVPHHLAVLHPGIYNRDSVRAVYSRMVRSAVDLTGEIPYKHYTFIIMGRGGGGLEHLNSQAVFTGFYGGEIYYEDRESLLGWMSFIAHEYYHLYNVKRIRPVALGPFNYDAENYTNMLWVSEGFTVYYEYIILNRAGLMTPDEMLKHYSKCITAYESIPGSRVQSATMASFDTWISFFNWNENRNNTTISYYDKGCGLALLLDLKIRQETDNNRSLDDVMRTLYYTYYKEKGRGFTDDEFRTVCEATAGCDLDEIFSYASTTVVPDYDRYLDYAGLSLREDSVAGEHGYRKKYELSRLPETTDAQDKIFEDLFRSVAGK